MAPAAGSYGAGPGSGSLLVKTYREGMAAKAGHDLVFEVARWEATVEIADRAEGSAVELTADPRSLEIREALHGLKPLTAGDRAEIGRIIDEKVLRGRPIAFRSTAVRAAGAGGALDVEGELTLAGATRPVTMRLAMAADDRLTGTATLRQSDWGIKPYRGLMGALKVRDEVEVEIHTALESARRLA
jgi:polyisoprenoid-binding protein YceI